MNTAEDIVITGTGLVCAAGPDPRTVADALYAGESAIAEIDAWDSSEWPGRNGGQVKIDRRQLVEDRKLHKFITRSDMLGLYAGRRALEDSGILAHRDALESGVDEFNDRSGVYVGSGGGAYQNNYDFFPVLEEIDGDQSRFGEVSAEAVSPMWLLRNLPNNVVCHIGINHQLKGSNQCVTNQCAGGAQALGEAAWAIRHGEADRVVVVGHDNPVEPETVFYYERLGLMSHDVARPFGAGRSGTVLGEAGAALMLEKRADAEARGARILGVVLASASAGEAEGIVQIRGDGEGVVRAIREALKQAELTPADIGFIVAHGNGTPASDASEAAAIQTVFGESIPPVAAFKWCFGHSIAASGVMDAALALEVFGRGEIPGIATLDKVDPALSALPVSAEPQPIRAPIALLICRGFGSVNTVTILKGA